MKDFLQDLMWTSYRYCIGRHTYVNSYAKDMGKFFYDRLTDKEKVHTALDIRETIYNSLQYHPFTICMDWSIPNEERRPLEFLLMFLNDYSKTYDEITDDREGEIQRDLGLINTVDFYKKDGKLKWSVSKVDVPKYEIKVWENDILDLLPWMDLASYFDVGNYKTVTDIEGNTHLVYESYCNHYKVISSDGKFQTLQVVPWKYDKIYRPVSEGVSNISILTNEKTN